MEIEHETFGTRSLECTLSTLALPAAVVRQILKTRVTLGNISRVLLNLTKRLIFAMFRDSSFLSMFTQLTIIFSLQFNKYCCFSYWLLFPCLICLVSVMMCTFNLEEVIYGTFEDYIGHFSSHQSSFLCQSLYLVIPLLLWQFSKSVWGPINHKLAQHNFWEFIFNFDARYVSRKLGILPTSY